MRNNLVVLLSAGILAASSLVNASDPLLFVFDYVHHGSISPPGQDLLNATGVYYPQGVGQLTPMGMRQMHMRGREMRRRYVDEKAYLASVIDSEEVYAFAIDSDRAYMSAVSFMTGLYPPGGPKPLWQNQTAYAKPPITVERFTDINNTLNMSALENNFQTVPIHSNGGDLNSMIFQGYDPVMCPIVGEIQMYELSTNASVNQTFENYTQTLYKWLQTRMNISGQLDIESVKSLLEEIFINRFEMRYVKYNFTEEEWRLMMKFMRDYYFVFKYGNDTVAQLSNTEFYKKLTYLFDNRAKALLGIANNTEDYLKKQKYWYVQGNEQSIISLIQGLQLEMKRPPRFSSSFLFELYQNSSMNANSAFNRSNYYVRIYLDDKPVNISGVVCDANQSCAWDSVAKFFESRQFKSNNSKTLKDKCFSHLNIDHKEIHTDQSIPWWLALVIAVPLVVITIAVIKIILIIRDKQQRKSKQANYNTLKGQNQNHGSVNNPA